MATTHQKRKTAAQTGLYLIVIAGILVVANVMSATGAYKRADITKYHRYTLSEGSGRLLKSLKGPVQVDAYIKRGLPALDQFVRDLTDLLKEYKRAGGDKFTFTLIEANTDELRDRAKEAGLQEMPFAQGDDDTASIAQGYMGLVFKYGSEKGVIPQISPQYSDGLEFWVSNKIREIRDKADDIKHRIGVITGKDELKLTDQNLIARQGKQGSPSIKAILDETFPFYKIEDVDLKNGDSEIDGALDGLIMTQPGKDYTDKELRRIDEFLMRGNKALAVYASAVNLKVNDATMQATLDLHGIDKLLSGYGIDLKKNAVLDFGQPFQLPVMTQSGAAWYRSPGIIHLVSDTSLDEDKQLLDNGFAGFFRLDEVMFPFPSSIELLKNKQPANVKLYAVARSTPQACVVTEGTIDMKIRLDWKPKPPMSQRIVAAVAEGPLKSAFGEGDGIKPNDHALKDSRVLVVSSSEFITNPFAYAGNGPELGGQFQMMGAVGGDQDLQRISQPYAQRFLTAMLLSVKNTLDWMTGDQDLVAASAKITGDANLNYGSIDKPSVTEKDDDASLKKKDEEYRQARKSLQQRVAFTLTLGLPIVFAGVGIGRWRLREAKKSQRKA